MDSPRVRGVSPEVCHEYVKKDYIRCVILQLVTYARPAAPSHPVISQPRTRTTFRLPLPPPPGRPGADSCALIPALTASMSTPDGSAGEYGDTLLVSGGHGCGGGGTFGGRFVPGEGEIVVFDTEPVPEESLVLAFAGCFPFDGVGGAGASVVCAGGSVLYGGLGTLSGLSIWIWSAIISRSCFSAGR